MTYPLDQLAIIAPILFIILIITFPVIGVFAGWKRGLYWGAGNFLFYIIGLIIWRFAGTPIAGLVAPLIAPLLQQLGGSGDITQLTASVISPIFFIVWFALAELILLINYYAWYKKVAGLKVVAHKTTKPIKKGAKTQLKVKQDNKMKAINMVGGALCLGALTIPTTISFTNAIFYGTTSRATRAQNSLANNLYRGLSKLQDGLWWMSYYTVSNTAADMDGLYAGFTFMYKEIEYIKPDGTPGEGTITEAVTDVFRDISDVLTEVQETTKPDDVVDDLNNLATSWNSIVDNNSDDVTPLFESENVAVFVSSILEDMFDDKPGLELTDDAVETMFGEEGIFNDFEKAYQEGKWITEGGEIIPIEQLTTINVTDGAFNALQNAIMATFELGSLSDTYKDLFTEKIGDVIGMIAVPPRWQ